MVPVSRLGKMMSTFLHQIDQYNASYSYFTHESLQMNKNEGFMKKQSFLEANLWQKQLSLLPLVDFF